MTLTSVRDTESQGYLEHIFYEGNLIAVVYSNHDTSKSWQQPTYKFSCKYKLTSSDTYTNVADCKHDLFMILEHKGIKLGMLLYDKK